ncbi:MAG: resolvase [Deltaproteobacteria bacterium HGW-Deltaproteobacteria-4]|nr:MAG: resolvase [Deltaproteobacteria bacterium HGW-Deltaproteobacteria-4]
MNVEKFISYCRVSTTRQGASGLGLEAQQKAISDYLQAGERELLAEFVEVESGKKNDRPKLLEALSRCRSTGATLIIAKLDRLARNVAFISRLMDSGVNFVAVDFPQANRLTVHILAAVAEYEGKMISERVKVALAAAKARGVRLGTPENLTRAAQVKGAKAGTLAKVMRADAFALELIPMIEGYLQQGLNLSQIAASLNSAHILSARGQAGKWTAQAIKNTLGRTA